MSRLKRSFLASIGLMTVIAIVGLIYYTPGLPIDRWLELLMLLGMLLHSQHRGVAVVERIKVSLSGAIHLTILFTYGIGAAMWLSLVDNIIFGLVVKADLHKIFFNILQRLVTVLVAGQFFMLLNGNSSLVMPASLPAMFVTLVSYTVINILLVVAISAQLKGESPLSLFRELKLNVWINLLIYGYVGVVFSFYIEQWGVIGILLFTVLLISISEVMRHSMLLISEQERWIKAEQELMLDAKTKAYNYRYLTEWLDNPENEERLALLFIDIDDFKVYNDRYGHEAGDHALKAIAQKIMASVRSVDRVVRFGGEEFVVILPDANSTRAVRVAKRIQTNLAELSQTKLEDIVTVSIGIALYPDDGIDKMDLIHAADTAMYRAKAEGKNQYSLLVRGDYQ